MPQKVEVFTQVNCEKVSTLDFLVHPWSLALLCFIVVIVIVSIKFYEVQVSMELNCGILSQNSIESICTAWRKGIRRIWHLPNTTHSALILDLSDT